VAADSLTTSLSRRRTRLRSTAVPIFLDAVKPTRIGPSSPRLRACNTKAAVGTFTPVAAARKSVRCLSRCMARARRGGRAGAEPLAAARAARGHPLAPRLGREAGAEAVAPLAHQIARLKGPLHGSFSAGIARPARRWDWPSHSPRIWRDSPGAETRGLIREAGGIRQCDRRRHG